MRRLLLASVAFLLAIAAPQISATALAQYTNDAPKISTTTPVVDAQHIAEAVVLVTRYQSVPVETLEYEVGSNGELQLKSVATETIQIPVSSGSGFFVTSDGYVLTNNHVVSEVGATYSVYTGSDELVARVVYRDPTFDLAVLKVADGDYLSLSLSTDELEVGDPVQAVGHAFGDIKDSLSEGSVVALNQSIKVQGDLMIKDNEIVQTLLEIPDLIETSAKVYPGDSGGPLLNQYGEVVGVNIATAIGVRVGYAIPASVAQAVLERANINP